ncbi:MAG: S8/S53 family peptidase [Actinobacteria bacterium]|nr:S8/S53 family peptidase [Actinomycetota bacterium]MBV9934850.1 S8/S53 family peptidase [Actinomycetota bacterium]
MKRTTLAAAVALAIGLALFSPFTTTAATRPGLVTLAANVLPGLDKLVPSGAPDPHRQVVVGVGLQRPDTAGEMAALRAMYDPKSPAYHHYLTPSEFADRFGVDKGAHDRLVSWLRAGGLEITQAGSSRDYVQAAGSVSDVERLFHTTLRTFAVKGVNFVANTVAPKVPADIPVSTVVGLNDLQKFSTPARPKTAAPRPAQGPVEIGLVKPADLWNIYEQPANNKGEGMTLGVFGEGATDSVIKDLRQFEKENGLRQMPVTVKHVGKGPFDDTSGSVEWDIDTQASTGMAPNALELQLYFVHSLSDADVMSEFSQWVSDANGPRTMNASFGECETDPLNPVLGNPAVQPENPPTQELGNNLEPVAEPILRQAVMMGRTLFASTGDTGSSCPAVILPVIGAGNGILNQAVPLLGYPAASPYVVGVGGTVLFTDGNTPQSRVLERAWEFGGGGTSIFIDAPDYQQGVPNIVGRCVTTFDGTPSNTGDLCRGIPDVSAISGDALTGYAIVANGQSDFQGAGTSLSSPLWAGMWTRVQAASPNPAGAGFANPAFYAIGKDATSYANDFFDITVGLNGLYAALPGWDYVTGWGVPRLTNLMTSVDGRTAPVHNVLPPLPAENIAPVNPACFPLWVDPAGDDNFAFDVRGAGNNPQLDLLQGDLVPSADGKTLKARLTINNLSTSTAPGSTANEYYLSWSYNKVTYFANAEVDITGAATFNDGTVDMTGPSSTYNNAHTVTGTIGSGRRGVVEIDVPTADVGNPGVGAVLTSPAGLTAALVGAPAVGGSLPTVDTGGPQYDFTIGQTCVKAAQATNGAPAPKPAPRRVSGLPPTGASPLGLELGLSGAAVAAVGAWLRRRVTAWPGAS